MSRGKPTLGRCRVPSRYRSSGYSEICGSCLDHPDNVVQPAARAGSHTNISYKFLPARDDLQSARIRPTLRLTMECEPCVLEPCWDYPILQWSTWLRQTQAI